MVIGSRIALCSTARWYFSHVIKHKGFTMKALVIGSRPYDFKAQDGSQVVGATVWYVTDEPLRGGKGSAAVQVSVNETVARGLRSVPGVYDLQIGIGAGGKARISGLQFLDDVAWSVPEILAGALPVK